MSDETDLFQLSTSTETEFVTPVTTHFKIHNFRYNEGEAIFSIKLNLNADLNTINRKTDSLFDWMGAWGGMFDGLRIVGEFILEIYSVYALRSKLTYLFIRFLPSTFFDNYKEIKFYKQYTEKSIDSKHETLFNSIRSNFT